MTAPVPIGITTSFSPVPANIATVKFTFPEGVALMTFQPVSRVNPGTATLYDNSDNAIASISDEGYETVQVPFGGGTYYFKATLGANLLAITHPSEWRN